MKNKINGRQGCLAVFLAYCSTSVLADAGSMVEDQLIAKSEPLAARSPAVLLVAVSDDELPMGRNALFGDDVAEPESEASSRESDGSVSRESLFGDDTLLAPKAEGTAGAPSHTAGFKGFIDNVMAYTYRNPSHWSEMVTRFDLSAQGNFTSNVKWKLGARVDYDAVYSLTNFYPQAVGTPRVVRRFIACSYFPPPPVSGKRMSSCEPSFLSGPEDTIVVDSSSH